MLSLLYSHTTRYAVVLALGAMVVLSTLVAACGAPGGTGRSLTPTPTSHTPASAIREFPLLKTGYAPGAITTGTDGAIWFTATRVDGPGGVIGRITTTGVITEYPLPRPDSYPTDITKGPDGNGIVWFTAPSASGQSSIGRITPQDAHIEEYTLEPGAVALRLTTGPDGALWFSAIEGAAETGKIGRITTAGAVTYYRPSDHAFLPRDITAGPDGALWFTETRTSGAPARIGRITTNGTITEHPLPSPAYASAESITTGPDHMLWFIESGGPKGTPDKLVRMATTGEATEFALDAADAPVNGLTAGPDRALWFGGMRLGRITTTGQITYVALPTSDNAAGDITVGPDGALWFTEASATGPSGANGANGKIGQLSQFT